MYTFEAHNSNHITPYRAAAVFNASTFTHVRAQKFVQRPRHADTEPIAKGGHNQKAFACLPLSSRSRAWVAAKPALSLRTSAQDAVRQHLQTVSHTPPVRGKDSKEHSIDHSDVSKYAEKKQGHHPQCKHENHYIQGY